MAEIDARVCASSGCAASFAAALHASAAPHLAPLPAERCTSLEPPPPPPSSAPLVHDAGGTAAVSGPATCGAAFRLPFPNGLGASDGEAHAAAALYAPDGGCFARGKLYGAGAGSCAAAPPALVAVYASAAALARGVSAGWWDGATTRLVAAEGWQPAHPRECQRWCEEAGAECGGFVVSHRVCMLRAPVGCEPALGDAPELPAPELLAGADVIAGLPFNCTTAPDDDDDAATALAGDCATPRCTEPPADLGTFVGDLLRPESCFYAVWSGARMLDVFRGKWMVFAGASNLILTASLFANMNGGVGGGDFFAPFQQAMFDQSGLIDIIWRGKDGVYSPLHAERYEWGTPAPRGATGNDDANRLWESSSMDLIEEQLAKGSAAAAFAADVDGADATVRTTLVVGQYWTNTAKTAAAIRSAAARANGWGDAKVVLYSQITNWYLNCAYPANPYCSRADLASKPFDEIKDTFEAELEETLEDVPEGWRVFLGTDCFTPGRNGQIAEMSARVRGVLARRPAVNVAPVHLIDYHALTTMRQSSVRDVHADSFIQIWVLHIIANSAGDNPATMAAAGCARDLDAPRSCFLDSVGSSCRYCRCDPWQDATWSGQFPTWLCANLRTCEFSAGAALQVPPSPPGAAPPPPDLCPETWRQRGLCPDDGRTTPSSPPPQPLAPAPPSCSELLGASVAVGLDAAPSAAAADDGGGCTRAWCGTEAAGWGVGAGVLVAALALCAVRTALSRRRRRPKRTAEPPTAKAPARAAPPEAAPARAAPVDPPRPRWARRRRQRHRRCRRRRRSTCPRSTSRACAARCTWRSATSSRSTPSTPPTFLAGASRGCRGS